MKDVQETTFGAVFQPWPLKPLPEVAFFQEGPGLRKWQWTDSGMKVVNVTNILGDGTVDVNNTTRFISTEEYESKYRHFTVDDGDIVVASSGNTYGKVGRINKSHLPLMMNTSVIRFHPAEPDQLNQDFLFAFLRSELFKNQMESFVIGSAQPNFGPSHLKRMVIPCPPLRTQRKIASVLSAYDDLIENNTRRIAILEEMAQAIYREWFINFRFPGHENVKLVESPLGQIPAGWEPTTVGDLAVNQRRSVKPQEVDPKTPYLGLEHIPRKSITLTEWGFAADIESTKHRFFEGEILFGKIRPYFHKVAVAPFDGICSSDAIVIVPRQDDYFPAVLCCVSSVPFVDHATQTSQGTKMPRANWDILTTYPLPLPPTYLLSEFNEVVNNIVSTLKTFMRKNNNLRTTRDLLLPKLISGKLDVEDLDIDLGMTAEAFEEAAA